MREGPVTAPQGGLTHAFTGLVLNHLVLNHIEIRFPGRRFFMSVFRRKRHIAVSAALTALLALSTLAPAGFAARSASAPHVKLVFWYNSSS